MGVNFFLNKSIDAKYYILEPGDMTKYKFVISWDPGSVEKKYLFISSGDNAPPFKGYIFMKDEIILYFDRVSIPPEKREYRNWLNNAVKDKYISYVQSHAGNINPCTAVAALICAYDFIENN